MRLTKYEMEEITLINQILKGDSNAFATIIDNYKDSVFALAVRMSGSREDAEEIVQDVFLKVYEKLSDFEGTAKFSTWLYSVAYNTTVSKLRSNKKFQNEVGIEDYSTLETLDLVGILEPLKREEQRYFLARALQGLKPDDRAIVELHYFEEMTVEEIVDIVGESKSNVKVKLFRARKKLCEILTAELQTEKDTLY